MQIVYISNRPKILNDTLILVERNMNWIDEVVIVGPSLQKQLFQVPMRFRYTFIEEKKILALKEVPRDHSTFNYLLRAKMMNSELIKEEFIMSDDDYRPLLEIQLNLYKENKKYHNYYFYNLKQWKFHKSSFDKCQQNSLQLLLKQDLPTLAYASHMPQIINKLIFTKSVRLFNEISISNSLCEWATYFNYGVKNYPKKFHKPSPFLTLCWPDYPGIWPLFVHQGSFTFENYCPHLYNENDLFEGIPLITPKDDQSTNLDEKIRRLEEFKKKSYFPFLTYRNNFIQLCIKIINKLPTSLRLILWKSFFQSKS